MDELIFQNAVKEFRSFKNEKEQDSAFSQFQIENFKIRNSVKIQILDLIRTYLKNDISLEDFRKKFDLKTRVEWKSFGFGGMSGAMFLNMAVKHLPDQMELDHEFKQVLSSPKHDADAKIKMQIFINYLASQIESKIVKSRQIQISRASFFISTFWHIQNPEIWPVFYPSTRNVFEKTGIYASENNVIEDYFNFCYNFRKLSESLNISFWELEYICAWKDKQTPIISDSKEILERNKEKTYSHHDDCTVDEDLITHSATQWMLAKIGRNMGYKVWVARNDWSKEYNSEKLGDLSEKQLPPLGLGDDAQKIISLIDVIWFKGSKQVIAAFEVEKTTSIYSGILRMSDLVVEAINTNFPMYIIVPEARLKDVEKELSRATFQYLELNKRCGFFSSNVLSKEYDSIFRYGTEISAIDKIARRIKDLYN